MNVRWLLVCICSATSLGFLSGCGVTFNGNGNNPPAASVTDVYVAGFVDNASVSRTAVYWKNGGLVNLPDENHGSSANAITISGSDVYVAGIIGNGTQDVATYWKNGSSVPLTDGTKRGFANSIFVSGNDVYVAGGESGFLGDSGTFATFAKYWKNGVPVVLTDGTQQALAESIFVSGSDVYVAGYEYKTTQTGPNNLFSASVAKYWKNGVAVDLTDGLQAAIAFSIFVSGDDVYAAGLKCTVFAPNCGQAAYWKNGTLTLLSNTMNSVADSIVVAGSDVYISGYEGSAGVNPSIAEYWKNGVVTHLAESPAGAGANQITVSGSDVYVAGFEGGAGGYWKNATPIQLTTSGSGFAIATSTHSQLVAQ